MATKTMSQAQRAERHSKMAALIASGARIADVAAQFGVCRQTVRNACCRHATVQHEVPYVRSVHASMYAPEWDGICLYRRALADACRRVATWSAARWQEGESEAIACDEHREALGCRVPVRREREAG